MYINRMVFVEAHEIRPILEQNNIPFSKVVLYTDYATCEITTDTITDLRNDVANYPEEYGFTLADLDRALDEALGIDIYNKLLTNQIDFVQVIYV